MDELARLTAQIYNEFKGTDEAITFEEAQEMAEMEIKAKKNCKNYVTSAKKQQKKPKTVKVSNEKVELFQSISEFLSEKYSASVLKDNKLLEIVINNKHFKVDLIETRCKKCGDPR